MSIPSIAQESPAFRAYIDGSVEKARSALTAMVAAGGPDSAEAQMWLEELPSAEEAAAEWERIKLR